MSASKEILQTARAIIERDWTKRAHMRVKEDPSKIESRAMSYLLDFEFNEDKPVGFRILRRNECSDWISCTLEEVEKYASTCSFCLDGAVMTSVFIFARKMKLADTEARLIFYGLKNNLQSNATSVPEISQLKQEYSGCSLPLNLDSIPAINDHPAVTKEMVLAIIDKTIELSN